MKRPSFAALFCGLVPFAGLCFSVPLWDRIHPMLFGLPFNLFWMLPLDGPNSALPLGSPSNRDEGRRVTTSAVPNELADMGDHDLRT
jgi:hypothetical protein